MSEDVRPSLDQLIAETQRQKRERQTLADTLLKDKAIGESIAFARGDGETALVGPDVSRPGRFRLSRFDESGPIGHVEAPTMRDAVLHALLLNYRPTEPADQLDKTEAVPEVLPRPRMRM